MLRGSVAVIQEYINKLKERYEIIQISSNSHALSIIFIFSLVKFQESKSFNKAKVKMYCNAFFSGEFFFPCLIVHC